MTIPTGAFRSGQSNLDRAGIRLMISRSIVQNAAAKKSSKQAFNTDITEKKLKPQIYTEEH
jgi:hypothetical protein